MSLTFDYYAPSFMSVLSLDIDLPPGLVDIEAQMVVTQSKEQILGEPGEQITAGVIGRSKQPDNGRILHKGATSII